MDDVKTDLEKRLLEDSLWYENYIDRIERNHNRFKLLTAVEYSIIAVLCVGIGILIGFSMKYNKILYSYNY